MALTELTAGKIYKIDLLSSGSFLSGNNIKIKILLTDNDLVNEGHHFPIENINYLVFVEGESGEANRLYFANTLDESGEIIHFFENTSVIAIMPQDTITEATDGSKLLGYSSDYAPRPAIQLGPDPNDYDATNPAYAPIQQSVRVGGFYVDANSLIGGKTWDESGYPIRTWGDDGTVLVCTGTTQSKEIAGSPEESGWCFVAGSRFGVNTKGNLYANEAHLQGVVTAAEGNIGGFNIGATSISKGDSEVDAQCIKLSSNTVIEEPGAIVNDLISITPCWPDTIGPWTRDSSQDTSTAKCYVASGNAFEKYVLRITNHNSFGNITYTMSNSGGQIYDSEPNCGLDWDTARSSGSGTLSGFGNYVYVVFKPTSASDSAKVLINEPLYTLSTDGNNNHIQNLRRCEQLDIDNISENGGVITHDYYACYTDLSTIVNATNQVNFLYGGKTFLGGTAAKPSVLKITFTNTITNFELLLSGETYNDAATCLIASTKNASSVPTNPSGSYVKGSTYSMGQATITYTETFNSGDYIYIVSLNANGEAQKLYLKSAEYLTSTPSLTTNTNYVIEGAREKAFDVNGIKCYRLPFYNAASNTSSIQLTANADLKAVNIYLRSDFYPEANFAKFSLSPALLTSKLYTSLEDAIWPDHIAADGLDNIDTACFNKKYEKKVLRENHAVNTSYSIADYKKVTYNNVSKNDKIVISLRYDITSNNSGDKNKQEKYGGYILVEPIIGDNIFTPSPDFYSTTPEITIGASSSVGFDILDSNTEQPQELQDAIKDYILDNETNPNFFKNTLVNYTTFINNRTTNNGEIISFSKNIGTFTLYLYSSSTTALVAAGKINSSIYSNDSQINYEDLAGWTTTVGVLTAVTYSNIKAGDQIKVIYQNTGGMNVGAILVPLVAIDPENCLLQLGQKFGVTDSGKLICTNGELGTAQFDNTGINLGKTNKSDNLNSGTYLGRDGIITDYLRVTETGGAGTEIDQYKYKIAYAPMLYNDEVGTAVSGKVFHGQIPTTLETTQSMNIYYPTGSKLVGQSDYILIIDGAYTDKFTITAITNGWTIQKISPVNVPVGYYILYR